MGKRGDQKNKIIKRIAYITWLLATAEKLTTELDFLKECLQLRKPCGIWLSLTQLILKLYTKQ